MENKFWETVESIEPGFGWKLFSVGHILWLALGALACAGIAVMYAFLPEKGRRASRITIAVLLITNIVVHQIFFIVTKQWRLDHLPLHMCYFGAFIIMAHAFARKHHDTLAALTYAISLPGAILALLTPNWSVLPFWNFSGISSFLYHLLLIVYPVMLIAGGYRPQFRHLRPALPFIAGTAVAIFILNKAIGTDFLFINGGKTVGWLRAMTTIFGIYGYLWIFPVIMTLLWTIQFLPFYLVERHAEKNAKQANVQDTDVKTA